MDNMKEEALRRASQMHRGAPYISTPKEGTQEHHKPYEKAVESTPQENKEQKNNDSLREINSPPALFEDKEKLLILMLLLLLSSEENSDPVVTLALLYLII